MSEQHGHTSPTPEPLMLPARHLFARLAPWLGGLGVLSLLGAFGWGWGGGQLERMSFSYLVAFLFWLSIGLGALFFVLVQFATRAGWSVVVRRLAEQLMGSLILFVPLFLPVALGIGDLYHWSHPEVVAADPMLQGKSAYLNVPFFLLRAGLFLMLWALMAGWYRRLSLAQDLSGAHSLTRRMQRFSGPGIALFALSVTFAAFDWIMSLDPHWYSTIFGVYFFIGGLVAFLAALSLLTLALRRGPLGGRVNEEHLHDLGKLLFAFTTFWSYIGFSQYFLVWYANIPEETVWFGHRLGGGWAHASWALALGHFVLPFFFLLPRGIKRRPVTLGLASLWMLAMHALDLYWLIMPNLQHHGPHVELMDLACFVGVGGLFLGLVAKNLSRDPLVPAKDPRLPESLRFENI